MPRGDKTGPQGMGPMTGRSMGFCAGYAAPGWTNMATGRGMGRATRMGRGSGFRAAARWQAPPVQPEQYVDASPMPMTKQDELTILRKEAEQCRKTLEHIEQRMTALNSGTPGSTQ